MWLQASDLVGYPAVIKPIYGAASIGVVRVDDYDHLQVRSRRSAAGSPAGTLAAGLLRWGAHMHAWQVGCELPSQGRAGEVPCRSWA